MSVRFWKSNFLAVGLLFAVFVPAARAAGECTFNAGTCTPTVSSYTCAVNPNQSGTCIATPVATGTGSCQTDNDCNASEKCTANACVPASCSVSCGAGKTCTHGQCVNVPVPTPTPSTPSSVTPNLEINIPGVVFTPALDRDGKLTVNWIGDYIAGVYKYLLGIAVTVAIVMIMIGGLQYVMAAGGGDVKKAKERINNAIVGLILLFSVYLILFTVSGPRLTKLDTLAIKMVERQTLPPEGEHEIDPADAAGLAPPSTAPLVRAEDPNILLACNDCDVGTEVFQKLKPIAKSLRESSFKSKLMLTSGVRTVEKQLSVYYDLCVKGGQTKCQVGVCLPLPRGAARDTLVAKARTENWDEGRFLQETLADGDSNLCPHTAKAAVDLWCDMNYQFGSYKFDTDCQAALIQLMETNGFCRLNIEPWHFELDSMKVSTKSCSTSQDPWTYKRLNGSTIYNYQSCKRWDAKNHTCIMQR